MKFPSVITPPPAIYHNTKGTWKLAGDMGTIQSAYGIEKVKTYQNDITVTNPDMSKNNIEIEPGKKNQVTTRTNTVR